MLHCRIEPNMLVYRPSAVVLLWNNDHFVFLNPIIQFSQEAAHSVASVGYFEMSQIYTPTTVHTRGACKRIEIGRLAQWARTLLDHYYILCIRKRFNYCTFLYATNCECFQHIVACMYVFLTSSQISSNLTANHDMHIIFFAFFSFSSLLR